MAVAVIIVDRGGDSSSSSRRWIGFQPGKH